NLKGNGPAFAAPWKDRAASPAPAGNRDSKAKRTHESTAPAAWLVAGPDRPGPGPGPGGGIPGRPDVPGPLPPDRHEPLPGAGPAQRQGAVQLPGRHGGPGALRRDRDGEEGRPGTGQGLVLDPPGPARLRGGGAADQPQGAGRGPV